MATCCSILPGESHGQGSLAGYSPWGCKESDTTDHRGCRHPFLFPSSEDSCVIESSVAAEISTLQASERCSLAARREHLNKLFSSIPGLIPVFLPRSRGHTCFHPLTSWGIFSVEQSLGRTKGARPGVRTPSGPSPLRSAAACPGGRGSGTWGLLTWGLLRRPESSFGLSLGPQNAISRSEGSNLGRTAALRAQRGLRSEKL